MKYAHKHDPLSHITLIFLLAKNQGLPQNAAGPGFYVSIQYQSSRQSWLGMYSRTI